MKTLTYLKNVFNSLLINMFSLISGNKIQMGMGIPCEPIHYSDYGHMTASQNPCNSNQAAKLLKLLVRIGGEGRTAILCQVSPVSLSVNIIWIMMFDACLLGQRLSLSGWHMIWIILFHFLRYLLVAIGTVLVFSVGTFLVIFHAL